MDEHQSRTLQDVLGSIYSEFGYSSGVETPATSVAQSRRSSNRSSIRSIHSLKLKRKNRKELIFKKLFDQFYGVLGSDSIRVTFKLARHRKFKSNDWPS